MERIPAKPDLSNDEMTSLREIVARSFMSARTVPMLRKMRLLELGLILIAMGGLMPTPAGQIVARM